MMKALRAVRDGGHLTRAEHFWLKSEQYIDDNNKLTLKGENELNNDDNAEHLSKHERLSKHKPSPTAPDKPWSAVSSASTHDIYKGEKPK
jgi:hypothetical protein